jgi:hypothetical protein
MPIFQQLGTLEQKFLVTCWADVAQLVEQPIRNRKTFKRVPRHPKDCAALRGVVRGSEAICGQACGPKCGPNLIASHAISRVSA